MSELDLEDVDFKVPPADLKIGSFREAVNAHRGLNPLPEQPAYVEVQPTLRTLGYVMSFEDLPELGFENSRRAVFLYRLSEAAGEIVAKSARSFYKGLAMVFADSYDFLYVKEVPRIQQGLKEGEYLGDLLRAEHYPEEAIGLLNLECVTGKTQKGILLASQFLRDKQVFELEHEAKVYCAMADSLGGGVAIQECFRFGMQASAPKLAGELDWLLTGINNGVSLSERMNKKDIFTPGEIEIIVAREDGNLSQGFRDLSLYRRDEAQILKRFISNYVATYTRKL